LAPADPTAIGIIERLRDDLRVYHDFATAHKAALVSLIEVSFDTG
jgi:hypothetical protein